MELPTDCFTLRASCSQWRIIFLEVRVERRRRAENQLLPKNG